MESKIKLLDPNGRVVCPTGQALSVLRAQARPAPCLAPHQPCRRLHISLESPSTTLRPANPAPPRREECESRSASLFFARPARPAGKN
jgi:hypothetical protein